MKKMILVLGMHRSGTSLVTHMVSRMGAYTGESYELEEANTSNEAGHFEYKKIRLIHDEMLAECGLTWRSIATVSTRVINPLWDKHYKQRISCELDHLFDKHDTIVIKDPRMAYFLPLWKNLSEEKKIIVEYVYIVRNANEVAESLYKRDGLPVSFGMSLWEHYNLLIQSFLCNKKHLRLCFDELFDIHGTDRISLYLFKVTTNAGNMKGVVKNELRHNEVSKLDTFTDDDCKMMYNRNLTEDEIVRIKTKLVMKDKESSSRLCDYEMLNDPFFFEGKEVFIYGAGKCGKKTAKILRTMGVERFGFCDKDEKKQGKTIEGVVIHSIKEIEGKKSVCLIVSLYNDILVNEIKSYLSWVDGFSICSFFALNRLYMMTKYDYHSIESHIFLNGIWYEKLMNRSEMICKAFSVPFIIYQSGKVGSSSLEMTLSEAGLDCSHLHRVFFKNDFVKQIIYGNSNDEYTDIPSFSENEKYKRSMRGVFSGKKIITLVREPIDTDLSTVFQWFGTGDADRYFNEMNMLGYNFSESVDALMYRIRGRLFDWFRDELRETTDIDVFNYRFNKEKGYLRIKEGDTEILVLQTEKMEGLLPVISEFTGVTIRKACRTNVGVQKSYADIYSKVKERITIKRDYFDFYYKNNPDINFFYSTSDIESFYNRWIMHVT